VPHEPDIIAMALDQSLRATGWALGKPMAKPQFGLFEMGSWRDVEGRRMFEFSTWLHDMVKRHAVTGLFYEAPVEFQKSFKDFTVTSQQSMQIGAINMVAYSCAIPVWEIDVNQMRERFIGHTKAPPGLVLNGSGRDWLKHKAVAECAKRGWFTDDHNVAEALGHLDFALSTLSKRHASQSDVLFRRIELNNSVKRFRGELA
jgi:hypothetical protein